jgi:predicted phosphodiesterase
MRILVLSDLHREIWREHAPHIDVSVSRPDIVVLAGDIDVGPKAVGWAATNFPELPVLYTHGNHESYGRKLEGTQADIRTACEATDNVHFLNCDEYVFKGVRFLGATLWTDFRLFGDEKRAYAMRDAELGMNDYHRIRLAANGYRKLRAADTERFHTQHKAWLTNKLNTPYVGASVVVTHMAPSMASVSTEYVSDPLSAVYASRLDKLVERADVWIHGHMHSSLDYHIGSCRVVCNPCGYRLNNGAPENKNFNANFIVEIDNGE